MLPDHSENGRDSILFQNSPFYIHLLHNVTYSYVGYPWSFLYGSIYLNSQSFFLVSMMDPLPYFASISALTFSIALMEDFFFAPSPEDAAGALE